jgi:hypothetical protein
MKGGSPSYAFHQSEGFLSQGTNVDHVKPLTYDGNSGHENFSNLYKVSGGGRKKRRSLRKRRSVRKRRSKSKRVCGSCGGCGGTKPKRNRRKSKKRLSRKKRGVRHQKRISI